MSEDLNNATEQNAEEQQEQNNEQPQPNVAQNINEIEPLDEDVFREKLLQDLFTKPENSAEKRGTAEPCQSPHCHCWSGCCGAVSRAGRVESQPDDHYRPLLGSAWRKSAGVCAAASDAEGLRPPGSRTGFIRIPGHHRTMGAAGFGESSAESPCPIMRCCPKTE